MIRKYLLVFLLSSLGLLQACDKSLPPVCGGHDPVNTLPWLKTVIDNLEKEPICYSVSRAFYNQNSIFIAAVCEPNINSVPVFYDCDGKLLNLNPSEVVLQGDVELIWKKN